MVLNLFYSERKIRCNGKSKEIFKKRYFEASLVRKDETEKGDENNCLF